MKTIVYSLFIFLTLLISCKEKPNPQPDYYLTDEDKSWNIYHIGDTIKFLSNHNHTRTYVVNNIYQGMSHQKNDPGLVSYEHINIQFNRVDTAFNMNYFSMDLLRGYSDTYPGFKILMFWYDDLYFDNPFDLIGQSIILDTLTINNVSYADVLRYDNGNNVLSVRAKYIYYNKVKGWLRIERNSGEIWDRIN